MTIRDALGKCSDILAAAPIDEARLKSELLIAHLLGCRRLEIHLSLNDQLSPELEQRLNVLTGRAASGEPIQYVTGSVEFMGYELRVDRRVLIPRPETETLCETALNQAEVWASSTPRIVDVGTGSGCIAIALAAARPRASVAAVDRSEDALEVAAINAAALGVRERIEFKRGDLLNGFESASLDGIVSNPPYIRTSEIDLLAKEIREHEPRQALDGGADGLSVISRLVQQGFHALKSGGWLFLEIGEDQAGQTVGMSKAAGFGLVGIVKDMSGHERIVRARKP